MDLWPEPLFQELVGILGYGKITFSEGGELLAKGGGFFVFRSSLIKVVCI